MTREEAKQLLPIMQAFVEGKTIQVWANDIWQDEEYPSFGELSLFRIKPEPKYRPFKTKEECWNEMLKHQPFGWIKSTITDNFYLIEFISDEINYNITFASFNEAFNWCTFADGTPFGIKEK